MPLIHHALIRVGGMEETFFFPYILISMKLFQYHICCCGVHMFFMYAIIECVLEIELILKMMDHSIIIVCFSMMAIYINSYIAMHVNMCRM